VIIPSIHFKYLVLDNYFHKGGKKMIKIQILKEVVVLLIAVAMILPTAIAANSKMQSKLTLTTASHSSGVGARGPIVWDNGMNYIGLLTAQEPQTSGHIDAYPADDFIFKEQTEVCDVHWIGGYQNGNPKQWDWCILFYADRVDGNAPGSKYAGKFCYTWEEINKKDLGNRYYEMWVNLPENIQFPGDYKFWISIWAVGDDPPQSGWGFHQNPINLHQAVFKSNYLGVPDWTDTSEILGYPVDMCFQLTTKQPGIDVEKYVKDGSGQWQDADTENEAVDLPICTNITFKTVITNTGDCPLLVSVDDKMHDSLKYISANPKPDNITYNPPFYYMTWVWTTYILPNQTVEIVLIAHVEGPECSIDFNFVHVKGVTENQEIVEDEDYAYVHAIKKDKSLNLPIINFLQSYTNLFQILQKLLKLGL
jgi:hypothetical protein